MHEAVRAAILIIGERYHEPLTLRGLAAETFFSPFYFSRLFTKETGMSPGRYLRAVRLFEAKRLLVTTSLSVADVVAAVGYSSIGSFTTRFTEATGMPPSLLREPGVVDLLAASGPGLRRMPSHPLARSVTTRNCVAPRTPTGSIVGSMRVPAESAPADVIIGIFDRFVPQCAPILCHALNGAETTEVAIDGVPAGRWHLIAMAMRPSGDAHANTLVVSADRHPIVVVQGQASVVDLDLQRPSPTDPPIAFVVAEPHRRGGPGGEAMAGSLCPAPSADRH